MGLAPFFVFFLICATASTLQCYKGYVLPEDSIKALPHQPARLVDCDVSARCCVTSVSTAPKTNRNPGYRSFWCGGDIACSHLDKSGEKEITVEENGPSMKTYCRSAEGSCSIDNWRK
ncbi:hypothetical protein PFISCL1PPCAC_17228 [Pristionchus fissidentatus]|uniref:Uncharacterized protein n=1 Tax=Pristionchus fissidentatus TaxID=1538716 RepID=A0AAV5W292_9BILA|nr:hypothetical protein PFISCL1PPCAC_17228 [Pristionchus fissidentatus]